MGQYAPGADRDLLIEEIRALQRRVQALETSAPLRSASISDGGRLAIKSRDGVDQIILGRTDDPTRKAPDGNPQMVFYVYRSTGEAALTLEDAAPAVDGFQQYLAIWDRAGNIIMGDDTTSGQGLARPYLPVPFYPFLNPPSITTNAATFTTLMRSAAHAKQHPRIKVGVTVYADAGTTGEVRLWDATNGVRIGSALTIPANSWADYNIGPADLGGSHMGTVDLDIQARRTGGAGNIGVQVIGAFAVQS